MYLRNNNIYKDYSFAVILIDFDQLKVGRDDAIATHLFLFAIFNIGSIHTELIEEEDNKHDEENVPRENVPRIEEVMFESPMVSDSDDVSESERSTVSDEGTMEKSYGDDPSVIDRVESDCASEEETNSKSEIE